MLRQDEQPAEVNEQVMARAAKRPSGSSKTRLRPPEPFRPERNVATSSVTLLALLVHRSRTTPTDLRD